MQRKSHPNVQKVADGTATYSSETCPKLLNIGYKRICDCPEKFINCSPPKTWIKNQVAIWEIPYEKRDIRDKSVHPASFPIALPARCIEQFTHRGELVLDPFGGIGSTLVAAQDLERNAVAFDLKKEYVDIANSRLQQSTLFGEGTKQLAIVEDAREIPKYLPPSSVALCVTSPPYANMLNRNRLNKTYRTELRKVKHFGENLQYSSDPRDLGTMHPEEYKEALAEIFQGIFPLLRPKAHCVVNINDLWEDNRRILLHVLVIEALQSVGYELRNIIIWDKRNLVNKVGIYGWPNNFITLSITFEYILDFWKPE